jgi:glutathione S-transferase
MELYFSPLACSLATRIALYESNADARFVQVDTKAKRLVESGKDYLAVHPLGLVPVLRTDDDQLLTENAAILQWVADRFPNAALAPRDPAERTRLQQWLCFIGTELHIGTFTALLDAKAPPDAKTYALEKGATRLAYVDRHLEGRSFLLDEFSVADAYLFAVLNWSLATPVKLERYPNLHAYRERLGQRPTIARAFGEELALYQAELAKTKKASCAQRSDARKGVARGPSDRST